MTTLRSRSLESGGVVLRLGVTQREFNWHRHDEQDELFLLLDGEFHIVVELRETVVLRPRQAFGTVIPSRV